MSNYVLDPEIREAAKLYDFRDQGKSLLIICKDHGDKLTGEECPYCRIAGEVKQWQHSMGMAITERDEIIAELEKAEQRWIPVSELPVSGRIVIAHYKNRLEKSRRIRAKYISPQTEEGNYEDECEHDWSDDGEQCWIKAGWYEVIDNWDDYSFVAVCEGEVDCWTPLPPPPGGEK